MIDVNADHGVDGLNLTRFLVFIVLVGCCLASTVVVV